MHFHPDLFDVFASGMIVGATLVGTIYQLL